jgi:hypothetical protein
LRKRDRSFVPLSRQALDYTSFGTLLGFVQKLKPKLSSTRRRTLDGRTSMLAKWIGSLRFEINTRLPQNISRFAAFKVFRSRTSHLGRFFPAPRFSRRASARGEHLTSPEGARALRRLSSRLLGFTEYDEPNISFRHPPCNSFAGNRGLGERCSAWRANTYVWRLLMPFDRVDQPCNLLSKLQAYPRIFDHITSLSHLGDAVSACVDLVRAAAPYGIYNVVNLGAITNPGRGGADSVDALSRAQFFILADQEEFQAQALGSRAPAAFWTQPSFCMRG